MDPYIKLQLKSLKEDLEFYRTMMKEVAKDIISGGFSDYPIFVAHQYEASIGEIILDRKELGRSWTIHASTLEEFVEKGIIQKDRESLFRDNFKDAAKFACIFMITEKGGNFVFYPYDGEGKPGPAGNNGNGQAN